jgi:hypothetical protein
MAHSSQYLELAEQNLYHLADDSEERAEYISRGQGWATLALAAAIAELAETQQDR